MNAVVSPQRPALRVAGLSNLRDFGGHDLGGGRRVVSNRLFRAAAPCRVEPEGFGHLMELGVTTVIDLRRTDEATLEPSSLLGIDTIRLCSTPIEAGTGPRIDALRRGGTLTAEAMRALMIDTYRGFASDRGVAFGAALGMLLSASDRPLMLHCTAGKDRTGFLVALVQSVLGVAWETIAADYLVTNRDWDRAGVASAASLDPDAREVLLSADLVFLEAAFDEIARRHGSAERFAAHVLGPQASLLDRLADLVVADAANGRPTA